MKRDLLDITPGLLLELALAAGWEPIDHHYDETLGDLVTWRHLDGRLATTNDPAEFSGPAPVPVRQAVTGRVIAILTNECPRCGRAGLERDVSDLTASDLDRAQVITKVPVRDSILVGADGSLTSNTEQAGESLHIVILHNPACEAAPGNLDDLARASSN